MMTKSERRHRIKFIQEMNYNKAEQKIFDESKKDLKITYKELYQNAISGYWYAFMAEIAIKRLSEAVKMAGNSLNHASEHVARISEALKEFNTLA